MDSRADTGLSSGDLKTLLGQCLKLATENKITSKNTWALPLIEHLDDLIRSEEDSTNFQRASVTLDAGVKIYGTRVDSVHMETFKILGGLGRAGGPEEDDVLGDNGEGDLEGGEPRERKRSQRHHTVDPQSTLEQNIEAINVKKFDLAFETDPLFQQTSAQFDEGGAQGLLLNVFGVYKDCEVMLDSMGIPEKVVDESIRRPRKSGSDLGEDNAQECFASYLEAWRAEPESLTADNLEPSMLEIKRMVATLAGKPAPQSSTAVLAGARQLVQRSMGLEAPKEGDYMMTNGSEAVQHQPYDVDSLHEDPHEYDAAPDDDDDGPDHQGDAEPGHGIGQPPLLFGELSTTGQLTQEALQWLVTGQSDVGKGWMGASHWRYRGGSGTAEEVQDPSGGAAQKRPRESRKGAASAPLDFVNLMAPGVVPPEFSIPPPVASGRGGRGKKARVPDNRRLLPEDYHYRANTLLHFALRPRECFLSVKDRTGAVELAYAVDGALGPEAVQASDLALMDNDDGYEAADDAWDIADDDGNIELVPAARKVEAISVNYARKAKHVDVKELKELLWHEMEASEHNSHILSFQSLLDKVPAQSAAGPVEDISVHTSFICVLHLANEHGLRVTGTPSLNALEIQRDGC